MQRWLSRSFAVLAAGCVLAGCSLSPLAGGSALKITPRDASYAAGSDAALELRNLSDGAIVFSLCEYELQQRAGSAWETRVSAPGPDGGCLAVVQRLSPGASTEVQVHLPAELPAGTWRVVFHDISRLLGRLPLDERTSASFVVSPTVSVN